MTMKRIINAWMLCVMFSLGISAYAQENEIKVLIDTDKGKITVKLYNETPLHRDNFLKLVESDRKSVV